MSNLNARHSVVIGAALVAVAVLAVAVTLLVTSGDEQPERERTVTTASSEITLGTENICRITLTRLVFDDLIGDVALNRSGTWSTPSCELADGTTLPLPTVWVPGQITVTVWAHGQTTVELPDDWSLNQ